MRDVVPIARDQRPGATQMSDLGPDDPHARPDHDTTQADAARQAPPAPSARPKPPGYSPPPQAPPARPPRVAVGDMAGVDKRTAARLRRGQLTIDARIDLHGMTRQAAHEALDGFIARAVGHGQRCVLVITGKGAGREDGGVLRRELPHWLNLPRLRPHVVAITEAQQRHGGGGAFYVLLRRRRG
jgi:DNA-nicking Smr family endonuclease